MDNLPPSDELRSRRNTISDIPSHADRSRMETRTRQRPKNWDDVAAMRAETPEAPTSRDGFSVSSKTLHPRALNRRQWRDDGASTMQERIPAAERRHYSSSDGEMEDWRSRARQRSLQRGERLRVDRRIELRKAGRTDDTLDDSSNDEAKGKRNRP